MYLISAILLFWVVFVFWVRRELAEAWSEPCLRSPVLVFEGDDWGFGPTEQAQALLDIAEVLGRHRDAQGRCPVMTIGVILSGPDPTQPENAEAGLGLDDEKLVCVRSAILKGVNAGVFSLQLHGMQHYHPQALARACRSDPALAEWRRRHLPSTEDLPPALQSRWTDGSVLPSRALDPQDIHRRVVAEVAEFRRVFGTDPVVAVPPTFVWSAEVETAWAAAGLRVLVTPGERYESRGADGLPTDSGHFYHNGQRCDSGLIAVVRNDYYEPVRGHRASNGITALTRKWAQRRPLLLETHRSNFVGRQARHQDSLAAIDSLIAEACKRYPTLCFVSVEALADAYATGGSALLDHGLPARLRALPARLLTTGRRRKVLLLLCFLTVFAVALAA